MSNDFLRDEIFGIHCAGAGKDLSAKCEAILHLPDGQDLIPNIVEHIDIHRDYVGKHFDYVTTTFLLPLGDVVKFVYPNRDNLSITIKTYTLGDISTVTYDFIYTNPGPHMELGTYSNKKQTDLNKEFVTLEGQCVPKDINVLKNTVIYGVYSNCTVYDVINTAFNKVNKDILGFINNQSIKLDVIRPNNTRVYEQILIPDTVDIFSLPYYLQKEYGVYNGNIGVFLQYYENRNTLFVYPLHRKDGLINVDKTLQVTVMNDIVTSNTQSTYGLSGNILKIAVEKFHGVKNDGEIPMKNKGTGVVTTDTRAVTNRPVEISKDGIKATSDYTKRKMNHKVLKDDKTYVKKKGLSSNGYEARSKVLENDGQQRQVNWNFSNSRLLRPYMGVIHLEENNDSIESINGVLHGLHIAIENKSKMEASVLNVFLDTETSGQVINSSMNQSDIMKKVKFL